jgi:uncharacterized membrane protein YbhN (UPF0104 family)
VTLLGVLAWRIDWPQLAAAFARINWGLWALAVATYLVAQAVSTWRWQLLAAVLDFGGRLGTYLAYYFIGMLFNLVLPTSVGGDVVRAWYLAAQEGSPPPPGRRLAAFLSVFVERFTGVLMLIALACVSTVCCPVALPRWITWSVAGIGAGAAAFCAGVLLLRLLRAQASDGPPAGGMALLLDRLLHRSSKLGQLVDAGLLYLNHRRVVFLALALSLVVQAASVLMTWLVSESLGLSVPLLYLGVLVPLVSLLTMLPISVNGMGLRETGTALLLAPLGVSVADAVTLSLLTFGLVVAASLSGVFFYLFGQFPRFERTALPAAEAAGALEVSGHEEPVRHHSDQGRTRQPPAAA